VVLICIFKLSSALYWVPKATLAAIIITAVAPLVNHPRVFYGYWKTSLVDFLASQIAFWVCLFVSTYVGLGSAVGFNILYILLRQVFVRVKEVGAEDSQAMSDLAISLATARGLPATIPDDVRIFRFQESMFFPNAYRLKTDILQSVQTHHAPAYSTRNGAEADRNWSVQGERLVARLRKKAGITDPSSLPPISIVVLDFTKCNHLDVTAVNNLRAFMREVKMYGGELMEVRFVCLSDALYTRLERAGFTLVDEDSTTGDGERVSTLYCYTDIVRAVLAPKREEIELEVLEKKGDTVETIERVATQDV